MQERGKSNFKNKAVLISIQPKWCELIANGKKTIEVRNTKPNLETPFKCYIYCTKAHYKGKYLHTSYKHGRLLFWHNPYDTRITVQPGNYDYMAYTCRGKVIGEFVCDRIENFCKVPYDDLDALYLHIKLSGCISEDEFNFFTAECGYGWHISALKIYDMPKKLSEFYRVALCEYDGLEPITRPPQSWCYVSAFTY